MNKSMNKIYGLLWGLCLLMISPELHGAGPYEHVPENGGLALYQDGTAFGIDGNIGAIDYDLDGDWDILMTGDGSPGLLLYRNDGSGFTNVTQITKLSAFDFTANSVGVADVNLDTYPDIFLGTEEGLYLFINQGDGTFREEGEFRLPGGVGFSSSVNPADFDKDGDVDIFVTRYVDEVDWPFHVPGGDILLVNNGAGVFYLAPPEWGIVGGGCGLSSAWTDLDADGDLDLMVTNDFGLFVERNFVYRNDGPSEDGGWIFTEAAEELGMDRIIYGMGIGVFDGNRDGLLDYYLASIGRDVYLEANGSGGVYDATELVGLGGTWSYTGYRTKWSPIPLDMDGDGWKDLYVRAGHIPAYWFINNPAEQSDLIYVFDDEGVATWSPELAPLAPEVGRGGITGDFNGDQITDLILGATDGGLVRYLQGTNPDPGIWVTFKNSVSAPGSPGVRTTLDCGEFQKVDELTMGGWFGSAPATGELFVGIPQDCIQPWSLEVKWPSGAVSVVEQTSSPAITVEEPAWWKWNAVDAGWQLRVNTESAGLGEGPLVAHVEGAEYPLAPLEGEGWKGVTLSSLPEGTQARIHRGDGSFLFAAHIPNPAGVPAFRFVPQQVVAGKDVTLFVHQDSWPGITVGTPLEIDGGTLVKASMAPGGLIKIRIELDVSAIHLSVAGESVGFLAESVVHPPFDSGLTKVSMENLYVSLENPFSNKPVRIVVESYDINHSRELPDEVEFDVLIDGELVDTFSPSVPGSPALIDIGMDPGNPGSWIEVQWNGEPIAPMAQVTGFEDPAELLAYINPAESQFGAAFESCRGDGMDRVAVVLKPRDSNGHLLPLDSLSGLLRVGGEGVSSVSTIGSVGKMLEGEVRCGTTVGDTALELETIDGVPTGITFPMQIRELEPLPEPVWENSTLYAQDLGSGMVNVNFRPRDEWSNLIGSGLYPLALVNGGEGCVPLEYCGIGKYCVTLTPPDGDHEFLIWMDGQPFGDSNTFSGQDPESQWTVADSELCLAAIAEMTEEEGSETDASEDADATEEADVTEGTEGSGDEEEEDIAESGEESDAEQPDTIGEDCDCVEEGEQDDSLDENDTEKVSDSGPDETQDIFEDGSSNLEDGEQIEPEDDVETEGGGAGNNDEIVESDDAKSTGNQLLKDGLAGSNDLLNEASSGQTATEASGSGTGTSLEVSEEGRNSGCQTTRQKRGWPVLLLLLAIVIRVLRLSPLLRRE